MVDHKKVEQAIRLLLEGIGEDPDREGLVETPDRIARMYEEICGGMNEDAAEHLKKTFTAENNEMVVEKDITFYSMCEHHMLPFYGKVHIAYIPDGKVVGLSKLARTVEVCEKTSASGTDDSTDRGCPDGESSSKGSDGTCRGRAYVYDHAWNQKAGKQDGQCCYKRCI